MENVQQRVLAYSLAKEISYEEVEQVSGGQNETLMTSGPSWGASGTNGSWDAHADYHLDW